MQDRYAGDIGDYIKLALLRSLSQGRNLGVAWYLTPDEAHNADGKHVTYLEHPQKWRHFDPHLFDALGSIVRSGQRSVGKIQQSGVLANTVFASTKLSFDGLRIQDRQTHRAAWYERCRMVLAPCDLVFADPDNGLEPDGFKPNRTKAIKSITLSEIVGLSQDRTLVVYHHLTRRKGGHEAEIRYQMSRLGRNVVALRARAFSSRAFFILNADDSLIHRAEKFGDLWVRYITLYGQ